VWSHASIVLALALLPSVARAEESPGSASDESPLTADRDQDGIPDRDEDRNADGIVDPGETDPRAADTDKDGVDDGEELRFKTDPRLPNLPEPLFFDMVRGLGARAGEIEINTLASGIGPPGSHEIGIGPEIEIVFAKGHALEIELPFSPQGLEAYKVQLQGTVMPPPLGSKTIQGWSVIAEYLRDDQFGRVAPIWIVGHRFDKHWSAVLLGGPRIGGRHGHPALAFEWITSPSVYYDLADWITTGIEIHHVHLFGEGGGSTALLLPQLHWQPTPWLKIQAGVGGRLGAQSGPAWAARVSLMTF
jgi:hypothetical protein